MIVSRWRKSDIIFGKKMYVVYVSYPYSDNPQKRTKEITEWAQKILAKTDDLVLLIPHLVFDAVWLFPAGYTHEEIAVQEYKIIETVDLFVYDQNNISTGVRWEKMYAKRIGKPILTMEELENGKRP